MPAPIDIPQELHDAIIDALAYYPILPPQQDRHEQALIDYRKNLNALRACSLVSRAFATRAQGHIYSTLIISCADASVANKKTRKRKEIQRSNRLNAIFGICASKPHIKRSIQSLFINLTSSNTLLPGSLFPSDTQALRDFIFLSDNVTNIYIYYGRPHHGKFLPTQLPIVSLHRLLPTGFRVDKITMLHLWNVVLSYRTVGGLVNLSEMSLSSVSFSDYSDPETLMDFQRPLRICRLHLEHVEDSILDLLVHNDYGRCPGNYPVLDMSVLREFRLGTQRHQYDNRPGYVYTLQQMLEKSHSSLEELELSTLPFFGGWTQKNDHLPTPTPFITLSHPRLRELVIGSTAVNIDYPVRSSFSPTQIKTWLEGLPTGLTLTRFSIKFRFKTAKRPRGGEASELVALCDPIIDWTALCSEITRIADGRPLSFSMNIIWVYWPVIEKSPTVQQNILGQLTTALEKGFDPVLHALLRQLLPVWITPKLTYGASITD